MGRRTEKAAKAFLELFNFHVY